MLSYIQIPDDNSFAEGQEGPKCCRFYLRGKASLHSRQDDHVAKRSLRRGQGCREGVGLSVARRLVILNLCYLLFAFLVFLALFDELIANNIPIF